MSDKETRLRQMNRDYDRLWRARSERVFGPTRRRDGQKPCGECHLKSGETCDICGAIEP